MNACIFGTKAKNTMNPLWGSFCKFLEGQRKYHFVIAPSSLAFALCPPLYVLLEVRLSSWNRDCAFMKKKACPQYTLSSDPLILLP